MMKPTCSRLALGLLVAIAAPALAQPVQGEAGERSRSVIRISVSVAPAFKREGPGAAIRATDRSLRFAVVTRPVDGRPSSGPDGASSGAGTLVLIVPD